MRSEITSAATANSAVGASAPSSSGNTARPPWIERPKSPVKMWPSQVKYWTTIGWSSASCWRSVASELASASSPSKAMAGSPGTNRISRNATIDVPNRIGTREISRVAR